MAVLDRVRSLFKQPADDQEYEPLQTGVEDQDDVTPAGAPKDIPFSWLEYFVFMLLGIAMLWAW
jgi:equilibrative nucleoside transporter 1/2/3